MPRTRIVTDVPPGKVAFLRNAIEADNGTVQETVQSNGKVTLVATYPGNEPAPAPAPRGSNAARWMAIAEQELARGVVEVGGAAHNQRILEYHATTTLGAREDEVPWCSSFANFCVTEAGFTGTNSALARSWESWGKSAPALAPGVIVVLSRGDPPKGHVGFFVGMDGDRVRLLGGNQGNRVSIASYDANRVIARRTL